jgi:hypothetical protein
VPVRRSAETTENDDYQLNQPDPKEQSALAAIPELRRQGHTLRGIAAILNTRGLRTRRGTEWRLESVARVAKHSALSTVTKVA